MKLRLVRREYVRLSDFLSHDRVIRDDDSCPRLQLVRELVGKVRTEAQPRCHRLGVHRPAFTSYPHPSRFLVSRCEPAGLSGRAFEHREDVVPKLVAAPEHSLLGDFNRSSSYGIAVAIDIHGPVGGANDNRDWTCRTSFRMPIVLVLAQ